MADAGLTDTVTCAPPSDPTIAENPNNLTRADHRANLSFSLVAAIPGLFAICTWTGADHPTRFGINLRVFAFPVLAVEIAFILLAFADGWRPFRQWCTLPVAPRLLLGLLLGLAFASAALMASYPADALFWTYISLVHLLFGFSAAWRVADAGEGVSRRIWPRVIAGCSAYVFTLALYVVRPHSPGFNWEFFGLGVSNIRQVGFYSVVGAMAAIGCAAQERGTRSSIFSCVAATMFALACWTGSRGALVASCLALVTVWLFLPRFRTMRAAAISAFTMMAGAFVAYFLPVPQQEFGLARMAASMGHQTGYDIGSGRLQMWVGAWHAISQRPLLGYGEAQFGHVVPQVQGIYMHPHNSILQLLFQWGLIGGAIVLALAILAARKLRIDGIGDGYDALPSVLVLVALSAYSLYDGVLFHVFPSMMFTFSLALILAPKAPKSSPRPHMNDPNLVRIEPAPFGR